MAARHPLGHRRTRRGARIRPGRLPLGGRAHHRCTPFRLIRRERRDDIHEAFLGRATCLVTHRRSNAFVKASKTVSTMVHELSIGQGTWSRIVQDGLWELAKPLIPEDRVRPQGGRKRNASEKTLFAAITSLRLPPGGIGCSANTSVSALHAR